MDLVTIFRKGQATEVMDLQKLVLILEKKETQVGKSRDPAVETIIQMFGEALTMTTCISGCTKLPNPQQFPQFTGPCPSYPPMV